MNTESNKYDGEAQAPLQVSICSDVSICKGFLPSYIKRKILPHFANLNNLPKSMDNPLWEEIQTVCGLTLAEMVTVMNARCQAAPAMGQAPAVTIKKQKKVPALHFTNLHFDIIITICEILDIDTLLSLYLALKKYVPLNPRNTTSAIEGLTWVINKKLDKLSLVSTVRGNKPNTPMVWEMNTITHRLQKLAKYDITDLPFDIISRICYLRGGQPSIPHYIADYTVNLNTPGIKKYAKNQESTFGMIRKNKGLADQLRYVMIKSVCRNIEKKLIPFYNEVLIDESGYRPNCFAHPIHILQQIVSNISQEQLAPFAKHVHTGLQADIKTLKRLKVPQKVGALAKKVTLKQQAMAVVLQALEEGDLKKEIAPCYVKVESYANMEAEARKKKAQRDARNKAWREAAQARQAAYAAQEAARVKYYAQQAQQLPTAQAQQLPTGQLPTGQLLPTGQQQLPTAQQQLPTAQAQEEEEVPDVTEFNHEGRDYYKGIDSEIIYDIESHEAIGIWDGTQIVAIV